MLIYNSGFLTISQIDRLVNATVPRPSTEARSPFENDQAQSHTRTSSSQRSISSCEQVECDSEVKAAQFGPPVALSCPHLESAPRSIGTVPAEMLLCVDSDTASDTSSLCHSPSWADYTSRERKDKKKSRAERKEARRRQGADKEPDHKSTGKQGGLGILRPRRLSKPPPQTRPPIPSRARTAPDVSLASLSADQSSKDYSTESIGRLAHPSATAVSLESVRMENRLSRPPVNGTGFIGGLKLKMLNDTNKTSGQKVRSSYQEPSLPATSPPVSTSRASPFEQSGESLIKEKQERSSLSTIHTSRTASSGARRDSFAERIGAEKLTAESLQHIRDPAGFGQGGKQYNSQRYSIAGSLESLGGSKNACGARQDKIRQAVMIGRASPRLEAREQQYTRTLPVDFDFAFDTAVEASGDPALPTILVDNRSLVVLQDLDRSGGSSRSSDEQIDAVNAADSYHSFILDSASHPSSTSDAQPVLRRSSSSFTGFRKAALSAITRRSALAAVENDRNNRNDRRQSRADAANVPSPANKLQSKPKPKPHKPGRKAERILGAKVSPIFSRSSMTGVDTFEAALSTASVRNSNIDYSDDRSSDDEVDSSSSVTTPTLSRPQSQHPISEHSVVSPSPEECEESERTRSPRNRGAILVTADGSSKPLGPNNGNLSHGEASVSMRETPLNPKRSLPTAPQSDLSFLPELKHQSLTRSQPSKTVAPRDAEARDASTKSEIMEVAVIQSASSVVQPKSSSGTYLQDARMCIPRVNQDVSRGGEQERERRLSIQTPTRADPAAPPKNQPIAKMFVICCNCKFYHDLPSKIYEAMAKGPGVVHDADLGVSGIIKTQVSW